MPDIAGAPCPSCRRPRSYKTAQGARKSMNTHCNSCANSISSGGEGSVFLPTGERVCNDCMVTAVKKNSSTCQGCCSARLKRYQNEKYRYARTGSTKEWFDTRYKGVCECCNVSVSRTKAYIDHCHTTGKVRGLLCQKCNSGLGLLGDNIEGVLQMVKYLEKAK